MKETNIMKLCMMALSKAGCIVWRNNTGKAWVGSEEIRLNRGDRYTAKGGELVIIDPRRFNGGLCKGSSDLIAIRSEVVTQKMVGTTIGIFVAPEIKTAKGRLTPEQATFRDAVIRQGGRAGVARSPEEAVSLALGRKDSA